MVKSTITQITALKSKNGKFLSEIVPSQDNVSEVKWRENINAFGILSLRNVRFQNENLSTYGNEHEELETLLTHYGSAKKTQSGKDVPAVVDAEKCRFERNFVKELVVREHYPVGHIAELWKMLATPHSDKVQNLTKLYQVALVLPTNTLAVKEVLAHRIELRML